MAKDAFSHPTPPPRATNSIALLYDDSAYVEPRQRSAGGGDAPVGLMGRQVAGREFLDACLTHGSWGELTAVVYNQAGADSLADYFRRHPAARPHERRLRLVPMSLFDEQFFPTPPAQLLYTPCPPDPAFAWARYKLGPGAFALSGVTHTLCTQAALRVLCDMLTVPYEAYDSLICTSSAVTRMVRAVTDDYADYLRERIGAAPALRPALVTIPLGVDPDRFRPPTPHERAECRARLKIADDAIAVLFVGRFSLHAKGHPFAMFQGVAEAARTCGRKVHLVLSGWAAHPSLHDAFLHAARIWAAGIPVSVVDGMDPQWRYAVWQAADVFTSMSDSIQETFGLVVIEAMASGLPVVASDWDGYRDLVVDGETGFLIPTAMVRGATSDTTVRLLLGAADYDTFLGECNQAAIVDPSRAALAYVALFSDRMLGARMGAAGRRRVLERFSWSRVVQAYEELWRSQESERVAACERQQALPRRTGRLPCYPEPEISFAGYPSRLLDDGDRLQAAPDASARLSQTLSMPEATYLAERRQRDEAALREVLAHAALPTAIAELADRLSRSGVDQHAARRTLAWLLKYGVLMLERP